MKKLLKALCACLSLGQAVAATFVGVDSVANSQWRTQAQLELDGEYGTEGYLIYGLKRADGTYDAGYDVSSLFGKDVSSDHELALPSFISDVAGNAKAMWSGNGNFGMLENPANGNALENVPLLVENQASGEVFTLKGSAHQAYRLTVMFADGDGKLASWGMSVRDASGETSMVPDYVFTQTSRLAYAVWDVVSDAAGEVRVAVNASNHFSITGFAFDLQPVFPVVTSRGATDIKSSTANLPGELVYDGGHSTRVWLCWGDEDAGEALQDWDDQRDLGVLGESVLEEGVSALAVGSTYYFRYHAVNAKGSDWSDVQSFTPRLPQVTISGGQEIEGATGLTEIQFLLTLSYALDEDITLDYDLGHITTDAQDFTPVSGQVTIPAGQTTAVISVWVNGDGDEEIDEIFSLSFSPVPGVEVPSEPVEGVILSDDGQHLSPVDVLADASAGLLYVAANGAKKVVVVDAVTERLLRNIALPDAPNGMCLNVSGSRLYVAAGGSAGKIHVVDTASYEVLYSWPVGHTPMSPCLSPDGSRLYVCNRFNDMVSVLDASAGSLLANIPVEREPHAAVLSPDGGKLFVANLLAVGPATSSQVAGHVSVIDTSTRSVSNSIALPTGSHSLRGLAMAPGGGSLYVTHVLSRYYIPTTQVTRGWINTNALSVIDPASEARVNTVLLDDMDEGAANPWGVACSPDGAWLCVAHAGTHELSVIDRGAMEAKLAASSDDASKDLAWMAGIRRRVALRGNGPRGIAIMSGKVFAAEYFSDSLAVAEMAGTTSHGREVTIGWKKPADEIRKGEMYYNDATLCLQKWQSCASCHPDGRSDGLNWDLLNDGFGNAKNSKSHVTSWNTAPAMVTGIRADAAVGIRAGLRYIQFVNRDESYAEAIDRYFESMKPTPSPHLVDGELSEKALRGKQHFQSSGCINCHSGPNFTDQKKYNVGTGTGSETGKAFDVPSLVELWRSAPYLYDGRAATVRDVMDTHGHGNTDGLSQEEIDELVTYLLSL
ncbi:c-type cytochrome [Verrucomicrobiaceae bacterium N1E253]|uniref:C-type cytochrome n=1 Tax=Oceaniferula marina TaxID=2748318 RepID=A0A851GHL4_9BACT|nr:c-type cytochrome [Oceaniferula marina]NWK54725.1 c-type cytochrome [Oceaniferula marina]